MEQIVTLEFDAEFLLEHNISSFQSIEKLYEAKM